MRYRVHRSRNPQANRPWHIAINGKDARRVYATWLEALQNVAKRRRIERIDEVLQDASDTPSEWHPLHLSVLRGSDRDHKAEVLYLMAGKRGMRVITHLDNDMVLVRCVSGRYRPARAGAKDDRDDQS